MVFLKGETLLFRVTTVFSGFTDQRIIASEKIVSNVAYCILQELRCMTRQNSEKVINILMPQLYSPYFHPAKALGFAEQLLYSTVQKSGPFSQTPAVFITQSTP